MTSPVQIKNDQVVRDIRELAALTREPVTEAVAVAVRERLRKVKAVEGYEAKRRAVRDIVERVRNMPRIGPLLTDEDLYDEDGMPR